MSFQTSPYEAVAEPQLNGAHTDPPPEQGSGTPPAQGGGPQVQKRLVWVDLPQAEYPGFKIRVWVNFPGRIARQLDSSLDSDKMRALAEVIVEHNGWRDEEGRPYPAPSDIGERCEAATHPEGEKCPGIIRPGFWDEISPELGTTLLTLALMQSGKLSTSLQQPRRGR